MTSFVVGIGGALGGVLRVICNQQRWFGNPLVTTIMINVIGAGLLGVVTAWAITQKLHPWLVLFFKTGVIGGFTTYGTWVMQTLTATDFTWVMTSLVGTLATSHVSFWCGQRWVFRGAV